MDSFISHLNTSIAAGFLVLVLVFYYLSFRLKATKIKVPPQAGGAWPIIGHLHLLGGSQLPHITLGAMANKYGPMFTLRLGVHPALVVSSWEVAKELFTIHDMAISSRPKFIAAKHMGYNYAMFGFSPYGPYWRELRKITSLELLCNRRLELLKHIQRDEIEASVKELYKLSIQKRNDSGQVVVDMSQWFSDLNLNIMLRMVAGKRYFGTGISTTEKEAAHRCQKIMRNFFHLIGLFVVADTLPFLGWLDVGGHEKAMKETGKELDGIMDKWLEEHRRKRNSGDFIGEQDFMDVLLSIAEGAELSGIDVDTVTKATCMNLIAGGSDTTTLMLTWALSLLMNNRHALKKAQEELDILVGKERKVNKSDINNLVYLQAIVKETLRLYPAAQLGGPREFAEDCDIGGYRIPKGTRLILNLWKLHRDPHVWLDPMEFRPERFLSSHKDIDVKGQHFELIPFGAGRRVCPGVNYAIQILELVLATLLHGFELSTIDNAPVDMTATAGLTNMKATPLEVVLVPRLSPNLY
ncbi:hypothetical protein LguiB_017245 [Lonicera macranthoides]